MARIGRPPFNWTPEIEDEIFRRLADGEGLKRICESKWLPSVETIRQRIMKDEAFHDRYARAREAQADKIFDEILEIADDASNDYIETDEGPRLNQEHVQRSRLRIDARKWMAGKLRPKVYGDRIDLTHANPDGSAITFQTVFEQKPNDP